MAESTTYTRREHWQGVIIAGIVGFVAGAFVVGGFLSSFMSGG